MKKNKYEVKCLFCRSLGYSDDYYCGNQERMENFRSRGLFAPNAHFSVKYEGEDCKYFVDENVYMKWWKFLDVFETFGKFASKVKIPSLTNFTGGKF